MQTIVLKAVLIGGLVVLMTLLFSKTFLRFLGGISYKGYYPFSPNWITAYGIVITFIGSCIYLAGDPVTGVCIAAFGSALDRIDGKMAHVQGNTLSRPETWRPNEENNLVASITTRKRRKGRIIARSSATLHMWWGEFNFPGTTDLGKVLDPFGDKLKSMSLLIYFGFWAHVLNPWLVACIIVPEVFGTLMRRPFKFMEKWTHQSRATSIGKYKAMLQWFCIIFSVPFDLRLVDREHWAHHMDWLPNLFLALSILLASASVLSRLTLTRRNGKINGLLGVLDKTVRHD